MRRHMPQSVQRHAGEMQQEGDVGKAFEDLLPCLLFRFDAEQEQGRSHIRKLAPCIVRV